MDVINAPWHREHRVGSRASLEQRIAWHREHAQVCACRPIPPAIAAEIRSRDSNLVAVRAAVVAYCQSKPGAWEDEPWEDVAVTKVGPKIFAFLGSSDSSTIGVKCAHTRDEADEWLRRYPDDAAVLPYLGRHGWNSLSLTGAIPLGELYESIDTSYASAVAALPRRERPTPV